MATKTIITRAYGRYHGEGCGHRVYPYDSFETLTLAPEPGKSGKARLLYSSNGSRQDGRKTAWCWVCNEWVQAIKRTQHELVLDYARRAGVRMRLIGENGSRASTRQRTLTLEAVIEQKRREANLRR